jgi:ABC-type multidrug transport system permease subunit
VRYFPRLPLLLRVAFIVGLLLPLASLALLIEALILLIEAHITSLSAIPPHWSADEESLGLIGVNLGMVSGACSFTVNTYSLRFRRSGTGPFPLTSWQSQVRAILLLAALPISALVLAAFIPSTSLAFIVVLLVSLLGASVLIVAHVYLSIKW